MMLFTYGPMFSVIMVWCLGVSLWERSPENFMVSLGLLVLFWFGVFLGWDAKQV